MSFNQNWAAYRDGFGSPTGNDSYWLGLDKVYHLMQLGSARLRVEVWKTQQKSSTVLVSVTTNRSRRSYSGIF